MGLPLIGGIIAGIGRATYGAKLAKDRSNSAKSAIHRAYGVAETNLGTQQSDVRQSTNESLNSRGILTAGAVGQTGQSPIRSAINGMFGGKNGAANDARQVGFYDKASAGSLGSSHTLSGQVNTNLSDEFYKERRDLNQQKVDALDENKMGLREGYLGAVSGGIATGAGVYSAIAGLQGGGTAAAPAGQPQVSNSVGNSTYTPGPMATIKGAFGMPANPQFLPSAPSFTDSNVASPGQPNSTFFNRGPQP